MSKIFIGLDLSLTSSGYCVIDQDASVLKSGKWDAPASRIRGPKRLHEFDVRLANMLDEASSHTGHCGEVYVAVEGYAMGIRGGKSFSIGEQGGVARLTLFRKSVPTIIAPPSNVKQFATGVGSADKSVVMLRVFQKWGEEFADNDICDAYVLAQMARYTFSRVRRRLAYEIAALGKCERLV